ncbi:Dyp-type peroxidase [Kitasatospora sp. MAP5-34]|uniref:Dyp-type peroxidase n=1 Tax=Kitasatospora sp. MAP5-34 TaxID=3035102 RepID=UPI002473021F|nr:Dyp-type peroxidase [Kitasatospora sp. MAP5-34]MDH6577793.1 putative iron-dependent peroxidase [Kitasatospora sp. MAP5-34]
MDTVPTAPVPQPVLAGATRAAMFLVLTVEPGGHGAVRELLADLSGLVRSVGFRLPGEHLTCVAGIGSGAWDRLFTGPRPAELHPFQALRGRRHVAPATAGDVLLHIRAHHMDLCFELASLVTRRLDGAARIVDETHGFTYFDQRDLLGFVDGTENPEGRKARQAAFVGAEDPPFAAGSYVIVQKYLHDLTHWDTLSTEEQEHVVGRTKLSDVELPEDAQPADAHVVVNKVLDAEGNEQQIVRANMPFGSLSQAEYGTYFIGYCRTPAVTEQLLRNMFLGTADAAHDRILDFSTATTGGLFFVPGADFLDDPPPLPHADAVLVPVSQGRPATAPGRSSAVLDGSLGIGSLKPADTKPADLEPTSLEPANSPPAPEEAH